MILILSQAHGEISTDDVIDWLDYFQANYVRLNGIDFYEEVLIKNGEIQIDGFSPENFNVVWSRRWLATSAISIKHDSSLNSMGGRNAYELINSIHDEYRILRSLLNNSLANKKWAHSTNNKKINKIENLELAKLCGLEIPDYIITSKKEHLSGFSKKYKNIICKPISEVPAFFANTGKDTSESIILYTIRLTEEYIEKRIPESFFCSLFQEEIEKEFEIRTFYLNGTCYSMAMFSQNDNQTKVDFRNYNRAKPIRRVPFLMPKNIENCIKQFCKKGGYKMGSIDLIKATNGKYYFLEINPKGQFGMVSHPCNYYLEQKLAKYLINENERTKERRN